MATFTVLKFDTPDGAEKGLDTIKDLARQQLIKLLDAAVVSWPENKKRPKTQQLHNLEQEDALRSAFEEDESEACSAPTGNR